nr:PQQ-dependent dehydrogenase, methanol/ethanol family [Nitrospirillum iridis]
MFSTACAVLLLVTSPSARSATADQAGAGENWTTHGGGADESGYSRLTALTAKNAGRLGLAWSFDLPDEVTLEATPLAVDGVLYFTGSRSAVYAVDGISGRLVWKYDPEIWRVNPAKLGQALSVNRGVAYDNGKVFVGVLDGRLVALDAKSGRTLWTVNTLPPNTLHTITGAPRTFNGKVIIGNGGADANARGFVSAYDQVTGALAWRFYVTPGKPEDNAGDPVMEMAAKSWGGDYWKVGGGGGTVWNGITFDRELNRIYLGTGNGGPYDPRQRSPGGGDNLFLASIVALDADTGKYLWHYQENPGESWDYKATANMIMATLPIEGKPRKVLMQAPTNGFFYVLDRETGKLISADKIGKVTWADHIDLATGRPVEAPNIRYETGESIMYPSMLGAHNWQDMAYSPAAGLVYIPYMQMGARYSTHPQPSDIPISGVAITPHLADKDDGKGALLAWDPVARTARWKVAHPTIWNGGTLATAGGLVFQGTADGWFSAYDARTGDRLWSFDAGLGIVGAPISYAARGRQYVSILVGYGGTTAAVSSVLNVGWKYGAQTRRLLTFALDGRKRLPPSLAPDMVVHAVDDPTLVITDKAVAKGHALSIMCLACHGMNMQGAGSPAPDLRESAIALSEDAFWNVVHDGALLERGMPAFPSLTRDQVRSLRAYIRAAARDALSSQASTPLTGTPALP